jgi:hypothetical protein
LAEGIKEGYLTCKVAIVDGRKATDRSWKTVYVVLKSKALYMYKDKKMAQENMEYEEKPVKLAESEVEVASDYTKRKNVFRVKTEQGSEYLFQVQDSKFHICVLDIFLLIFCTAITGTVSFKNLFVLYISIVLIRV